MIHPRTKYISGIKCKIIAWQMAYKTKAGNWRKKNYATRNEACRARGPQHGAE